MKKKIKLGFLALSLGAVVATLAVTTTSGNLFNRSDAGSDEVWNHYIGVKATMENRGIKEYWVSCSTHVTQFEAPLSGTIMDKGAPSLDFINSLTDNDERLIMPFHRIYDFEDGVIPECIIANNIVTGALITTDGGVEGSKALEVTVKAGDFKFGFDKDYLDAAFASNAVKAVAFDAKSTVASENWRYDTPQGEPSASASQPYEAYSSGNAGVATTWKTFFFTRKMYNSWVDNVSYMIKGSTGVATITIDNVRPVTYDIYDNITQFGFESNCMKSSSSSTFEALRGASANAITVSGAGLVADSWGYAYDKKTEGNRSMKFTKQSGYLALSLNTSIINTIPGDYVVFDLYTTSAFNSKTDNLGMATGMNGVVDNEKQIPGNKWITLTFKKNCSGTGDITTDGRFLILQGSTACDVYLDNIRGIDKLDDLETAYAFNAGQYGYALDYKTETTETAGGTIRDTNKNYTFLVNGGCCAKTEVTTEKSSTGNKSVKYTWSGKGYCAMFINPLLLNMVLPKGFSVSFDIWASKSFTGGTFMGNAVNSHIGEWTTVTIDASNFEYDATKGNYNGRFSTANYNEAGVFYVDNFQLIAPQAE